MNVKVIGLTGPGLVKLEGVIISLADMKTLPKLQKLPHHIVEVFYESDRVLQDVLLSHDQIMRLGQADERFQYSCRALGNSLPGPLKDLGMCQLPSAEKLLVDIEAQQVDRQCNDTSNLQLGANVAGSEHVVSLVSSSTLEGEQRLTMGPPDGVGNPQEQTRLNSRPWRAAWHQSS